MSKRAQGLPVNMIVLTALALLVLVVVGAFFISGFGQASSSVQVVDRSQSECGGTCQGIAMSAYNYDSCKALYGFVPSVTTCSCAGTCTTGASGAPSCTAVATGVTTGCTGCTPESATCAKTTFNCALSANPQVVEYKTNCADKYGACTVTIRGGGSCTCDGTGCH